MNRDVRYLVVIKINYLIVWNLEKNSNSFKIILDLINYYDIIYLYCNLYNLNR